MKRILTTVFACTLIVTSLSAQRVVERLGRRLERVAEQKAEEVIGKKLEEKFGDIMEEIYTMGDDSTSIRVEDDKVILTESDGTEVELTTEPDEEAMANVQASSWVGSFVIETREFKGDRESKDSPMIITYYVEPYEVAMDIPSDEGDARMIMHRRTRKITMLMTDEDGNKTGTKMPMLRVKTSVGTSDTEPGEFSIEATGNSKTISGFFCKEYAITTDEMTGTAWLTEEWNLDYGILFDFAQIKNANTGQDMDWANPYGVPGVLIESRMEERDSNKVVVYSIKSVEEGSHPEAFSTDGYEMTDMGSLFGN